MPPRKRPAWVDPVDEQPPPRAPPPKRSQYVHPEDDPDYVKPPPKRPSPKAKAAPVRERPEWNSGGEEPGYDPKYPPPVWAQEIVSLHGRGFKHLDQDVYVHPEDDPNWKGPPRPDFEKSTIDQSWGGRRVDCPTAKMVWRCPACLAEWEADEPVTCPRCHTKEEPPRPTYGIMFPLIEAMQMIDDGEDPRHGRIDARLDQLMKEQIEAVGGKRKAPPKRAPVGDGKRRVIVIDPSEPGLRREPGAIYLEQYELTAGDVGKKCSICKMGVRKNTRNVKLGCGDLFHSNCITQYLKTHETCPNCGKKVE